jgi:hypothetical protein
MTGEASALPSDRTHIVGGHRLRRITPRVADIGHDCGDLRVAEPPREARHRGPGRRPLVAATCDPNRTTRTSVVALSDCTAGLPARRGKRPGLPVPASVWQAAQLSLKIARPAVIRASEAATGGGGEASACAAGARLKR